MFWLHVLRAFRSFFCTWTLNKHKQIMLSYFRPDGAVEECVCEARAPAVEPTTTVSFVLGVVLRPTVVSPVWKYWVVRHYSIFFSLMVSPHETVNIKPPFRGWTWTMTIAKVSVFSRRGPRWHYLFSVVLLVTGRLPSILRQTQALSASMICAFGDCCVLSGELELLPARADAIFSQRFVCIFRGRFKGLTSVPTTMMTSSQRHPCLLNMWRLSLHNNCMNR